MPATKIIDESEASGKQFFLIYDRYVQPDIDITHITRMTMADGV